MGTLSVCCSVQKVLWKRTIILIDSDLTEICKDVRIIDFSVVFLQGKFVGSYDNCCGETASRRIRDARKTNCARRETTSPRYAHDLKSALGKKRQEDVKSCLQLS